MANFARLLGAFGPANKNFQVSLNPQADLSTFANQHIVLIGNPSTNAQIAKLNDALPQPFVAGEDTLKQQAGGVIYRTPQGTSIGLVEVLSAPWNPGRGITLITGTTDEGVRWALDKVADPEWLDVFLGNTFFVGPGEVRASAIQRP
jgi:hypothetical protein